jgi:hypothetical protein
MVEEVNEYFEKYTEPVTIVVNGEDQLTWIPGHHSLASAPGPARDIAIFLKEYIEAASRGDLNIMVTPEGPYLPASVRSIYTVVWALLTVYGSDAVEFIGDAPNLRDMGLDEGSNFDPNGKPIIR